jgi:hypothetical protein
LKNAGRIKILRILMAMEKGLHFRKFPEVEHIRCTAFRLEPRGTGK